MIFDLIIVGGGPGGVTAAIYAKRSGLNVALFEKQYLGGQVVDAYEIENYPGFSNVNGFDLSFSFQEQLRKAEVTTKFEEVIDIIKEDNFKILTNLGNEYYAKNVILALGRKPKKLNVDNENKYIGRGLSFCATCDGNFYKNKDVVVVGGGNSAVKESIYLSPIVNSLTIVTRSTLKADKSDIEKLNKLKNIKIIEFSKVFSLKGQEKLESVIIENVKNNEKNEIKADGLFVYVGQIPPTNFLEKFNILNEQGYVKVDEHFETSVKGLYSIGDTIEKEVRQIVTATSDAAIAIHFIKENID